MFYFLTDSTIHDVTLFTRMKTWRASPDCGLFSGCGYACKWKLQYLSGLFCVLATSDKQMYKEK